MHIAGHVDKWCDPPFLSEAFLSIYQVDTEVCEQTQKLTGKKKSHFMSYVYEYADVEPWPNIYGG